MKKIFFTIIALSLAPLAQALPSSSALGEEKIEPVFYPKFSIIGDFSVGKRLHALDFEDAHYDMPSAWGSGFAFEAGLYRYFNAGAILAFRIPLNIRKQEPLLSRLLLFAKPFYPITSNFAIFSRIGAGIMSSFLSDEIKYLQGSPDHYVPRISDEEKSKVYSDGVNFGAMNMPFGASAVASIGAEFFPTNRLGLALEWGVRADFSWIIGKPKERLLRDPPLKNPNGKTTISYMTFDFPVTLTLHMIP